MARVGRERVNPGLKGDSKQGWDVAKGAARAMRRAWKMWTAGQAFTPMDTLPRVMRDPRALEL